MPKICVGEAGGGGGWKRKERITRSRKMRISVTKKRRKRKRRRNKITNSEEKWERRSLTVRVATKNNGSE